MGRVRGAALVMVVSGSLVFAGLATAAVPGAVSRAVGKWVSTSLEIQRSAVLPTARSGERAISAAVGACEKYSLTRPGLKADVDGIAANLQMYVKETERGELKLYKLAPKLGSKHNATRRRYLRLLNLAGDSLDTQLGAVRQVKRAAGELGAGSCRKGADRYTSAVGTLVFTSDTFKRRAEALRAAFG